MSSLRKRKTTELEDKKELKPQNKTQKKQSQVKEKDGVYDIIMLLKYWKATIKEPIKDLCNIIGKFYKNIEEGLLYATGYQAALTVDNNGHFKDIDTLSHIPLKNKDGDNVLVKDVMNGSWIVHAFLLENGKMRVIEEEGSFDIELESGIIKMNSGNHCKSLFVIDKKMRAYEIKNKTAVIITGLNGIKIKDISCGCQFTLLLSKSGQLYGLGLNIYSILGLPRRIEKTEIPTKITFPNQDDSDKNGIIITMMHASMLEYVAVDSKHRAWIIGDDLTQFVSSYYEFLDPSISIVQVWHSNNIRITQIKCGCNHVIALDTEGKVYWFGQFEFDYNDHFITCLFGSYPILP